MTISTTPRLVSSWRHLIIIIFAKISVKVMIAHTLKGCRGLGLHPSNQTRLLKDVGFVPAKHHHEKPGLSQISLRLFSCTHHLKIPPGEYFLSKGQRDLWAKSLKRLFTWKWGTPGTYHVNMITLKYEIIWTGGFPHLPGAPHLHVKRP